MCVKRVQSDGFLDEAVQKGQPFQKVVVQLSVLVHLLTKGHLPLRPRAKRWPMLSVIWNAVDGSGGGSGDGMLPYTVS